jgi:hypothetical protein
MISQKVGSNRAVIVILFSILFSCEDNFQEVNTGKTLFNIKEAQTWFETLSKSQFIEQNLEKFSPRWDKAVFHKYSVEMPFTVDGKLQMPHSEYGLAHKGRARLVIYNAGKGFSAHIINYSPSMDFRGDIKKINASNYIKEFEGKVTIEPLTGGIRDVMVEQVIQNNNIVSSQPYSKWKNGEGSELRVQQWWQQCTDWYQWVSGEWSYLDTTCDIWWESDTGNNPYTPGWPESGGSGSSGSSPENGGTAVEIIVDNSITNHPKANCIYDKLRSNTIFNSLISAFDNNGGTINLYFKLGTISGTENGITSTTYPYNEVTITLDQVKLETRRTVEVARTFLHEYVHAKIFAELAKAGIASNEELTSDNFPGLFDAYVEYKNGNIPAEQVQHQYMASHYVDLIATALREFDTQNHNNPEITMDHYVALAWMGLSDTKAWIDLSPEVKSLINSKRNELLSWYSYINCN